MRLSRRDFVKGMGAGAAVVGLGPVLSPDAQPAEAATVQPNSRAVPPAPPKGLRPNFLIILCDQMRYPPVYESEAIKMFREQYLVAQNFLRGNGVSLEHHYAASAACVPSRASLITGHYPSCHGASQTTGAAKEPFDREVFWLDPDAVPTFGDYFRAAGYRTYWKGKWHASAADLHIPGTHTPIPSYDTTNGERDPAREALYLAADRLDPFGFSGWIGPEPHGSSLLDSGSTVPEGQRGRDVGFAEQTVELIQELDHDRSTPPWLVVCSLVNPHDISLWGLWSRLKGVNFEIEDCVPEEVFGPQFTETEYDDLSTKPSCQANYQETYHRWMQPIFDDPSTARNKYYRYYYQLQKNVDEQMQTVIRALLDSRFKDDTIVILTSDHGELLGSHHDMHQKWYQTYDEAIRVPFFVWNSKMITGPRAIDALTSHADLVPTLLGLAGLDAESLRRELALSHSDPRPLVGRDLSRLILGEVDPTSVNDPVFFMTDDDVTRGPDQNNLLGLPYNSVNQPNHLESVIARLDDGCVWKYTRYFDNTQFWTDPGACSEDGVEDVVMEQRAPNPPPDEEPHLVPFDVTVKDDPTPEEFELYNLTLDAMEVNNRYDDLNPIPQQLMMAQLLQEQCMQKRLTPMSGNVPGQPTCDPPACGA